MVLERVAVHQTRLRVPGVSLDARGVVLGTRGLVLLPSLDRLAAFLSVYTSEHALEGLVDSMRIEIVESKLGAREAAISFEAGSSDRMDRVAEVARLAGGFTFTGTSRHFVQYRDTQAPFGYDSTEITATDASLVLYHTSFSQVYAVERRVELQSLLLRLMPRLDPRIEWTDRRRWILAEGGLGPGLTGYFVRSSVDARAGAVEWPPETSFDTQPVRRWLFDVVALPARMWSLVRDTPGLSSYVQAAPGVAVEEGWEHPVHLRACPVFDPQGLVLFRGRAEPPLTLDRVPVLGDVRSIARVGMHGPLTPVTPRPTPPERVKVDLRLLPTQGATGRACASFVPKEELPLLRRLAYALGREALERTLIAFVDEGAFLLCDAGVEAIPLGRFYWQPHESVYLPIGFELVPRVTAEMLASSLGAVDDHVVFFRPAGGVAAVPRAAFQGLLRALLDGQQWAPLDAHSIGTELAQDTAAVLLPPLGLLPLSRAKKSS